MEKLKKTAVVIDKVLKVFFIIILVCMILLVVSDIIMLAVGPMNLENGRLSYNIMGANIVIADTGELAGLNFNGYQLSKAVLMASVSGAIGMIVILVGIKMLREIIAPMKEGGPFVEGISVKMRNFGIFVLVAGFVGSIIEWVMMFIISHSISLRDIEAMGEIIGGADSITLTYNYSIDGSFIIFALFIFLLSYIFKYGEELQKQSDETL